MLLGRVITSLGTLPADRRRSVIENMFASDVAFLQDFYRRINAEGHTRAAVTCPECSHRFTVDLAGWAPGGIVTYAPDRIYEEVAYVAYHFHWSLDDILDLEHAAAAALRQRDRVDQHPALRGAGTVNRALALAAGEPLPHSPVP